MKTLFDKLPIKVKKQIAEFCKTGGLALPSYVVSYKPVKHEVPEFVMVKKANLDEAHYALSDAIDALQDSGKFIGRRVFYERMKRAMKNLESVK